MSRVDQVLSCADNALRTLSGTYVAARPRRLPMMTRATPCPRSSAACPPH